MMVDDRQSLFDSVAELPSSRAKRRFELLVGLEDAKSRLVKGTILRLDPEQLLLWSTRHYGSQVSLIDQFFEQSPLFILAGDVGTGKSTIAEAFGDPVAREMQMPITLYRLSLSARGRGAVGEMTKLLSSAFREVRQTAEGFTRDGGRPGGAVIFLIDEADALAQSRELDQMHHEDRAGVNALIRGIDDLSAARVPVVVVMCTNRMEAIDPGVRRRAAEILEFRRPDLDQRKFILTAYLQEVRFSEQEIADLAKATGDNGRRRWGFTYSDLTQRLMPAILLDAAPDRPIEFDRALALARSMEPTPPFNNKHEEVTGDLARRTSDLAGREHSGSAHEAGLP